MLDKLRKAPVVILTIGGSVSKNTIRDFSAILENRYTNTIQMDKLRFVCNTWKQVSDMTFVQMDQISIIRAFFGYKLLEKVRTLLEWADGLLSLMLDGYPLY